MEKKAYREIFKTFPRLKEIRDARLQEKVLRSWARALREGFFRNLEEIPFSPEIPETNLVSHINWVLEAALFISRLVEERMNIRVDRNLLIASALLHDLGKAFEYQRKGKQYGKSEIGKRFMHGFWGAYLALEEGVSRDLAHLISTHSKDSPAHPQLIEGIILHYADFVHADILRFQKGMDLFLSQR